MTSQALRGPDFSRNFDFEPFYQGKLYPQGYYQPNHSIHHSILKKIGVDRFSIFNGFRENWIYVPKSQKIPFLPIFDTWHIEGDTTQNDQPKIFSSQGTYYGLI